MQEDMASQSGGDDGGGEAHAIEIGAQLAVVAELPGGVGSVAVQGQGVAAAAIAAIGDGERLFRLMMAQQQGTPGGAVQAPAVTAVPGRVSILPARRGALRCRRFPEQFGQARQQPGLGRRCLGTGFGKEQGAFAFDQAGVEIGRGECRAGHQPRKKIDVVGDADHAVLRQRLEHSGECLVPGFVPDDQLRDHRVVVGRDRVALFDAAVDAHMERFFRRCEMCQCTSRGQEALVGILGIDPRLQRMAADRKLFLGQRQRLAGGHAQLPFDQIYAGDHFGHGMLDLQSGVHLHEVKGSVAIDDELDRASTDITDRSGGRNRCLTHRGAPLRGHARRRRLFEHFLVTALDRAVAFEQMHNVALHVAKDLEFDMTRTLQIFLDQHMLIAE